MLYSNNFIANQLFLTIGARQAGLPATWEKGKRAMNSYFEDKFGLGQDQVYIQEGSGISRRNKITARAMITILQAFQPHANLLPLEKGRRIKSGTLEPEGRVRAIISPHAGYVFSGTVAASAVGFIPSDVDYDNIFIIGSSHRVSFPGASVYTEGNYKTPLGMVEEYAPTFPEVFITLGIWALGFLMITIFYKITPSVRENFAR